ncbi:MAG: DUF2723 domain-containing protein, partial [candidate division WS1 bacterium]|nr:DUF2723 domain-containing protein [candidate division WS1 bacterium]
MSTSHPRIESAAAVESSCAPGIPWLLGLLALVVRLPFLTQYPLAWDSVQFVLGVEHYSVALHQPHPPGYFLYVHLARLLHLGGLSPYGALVAISVVSAAAMTVLLAYWAGKLAGNSAALATGILCIVSPLAWWMATVGLSYGPSGFLSALMGYLCWRLYRRPEESVWWSGITLGIIGGVRPSDCAFLLPLWLFCIWHKGWRPVLSGLLVLAVTTGAWMMASTLTVQASPEVPSDGLAVYASKYLWDRLPLSGHWNRLLHNLKYLGTGLAAMLMGGWICVFFARGNELTRRPEFLLLWTLPAVAFFSLMLMDQLGYAMVLFPPVVLLAGLGLARLQIILRPVLGTAFWLLLMGNLAFYTAQTIILPQREGEANIETVRAACEPYRTPETVLLTNGEWRTKEEPLRMLPYRLAMYLFPEVRVYRFPLEPTLEVTGGPNAGYQKQSAMVKPP